MNIHIHFHFLYEQTKNHHNLVWMYYKLQISFEKKSTSQVSYLQLQNPNHHPSYQRLEFFVGQDVLKVLLIWLNRYIGDLLIYSTLIMSI